MPFPSSPPASVESLGSYNWSAVFEVAIFDLVGKTLGVPVYQLLGGKYQERVAVGFWTGSKTGPEMQDLARKAWAMGYRGFKFKQSSRHSMVEQVRDVATGAPEMAITVDAMSHFKDIKAFLREAEQLAGLNIQCIEDPMPFDIGTYARLSEELQKLNIPLCIHNSAFSLPNLQVAMRSGACQVVNLSMKNMRTFVRMSHLVDAFGLKCWHGSTNDLGVLDASYLHAIAATPNCIIPSDVHGHLLREHDLLRRTPTVEGGFAVVPDEPGLGVELDEDAVSRYRV